MTCKTYIEVEVEVGWSWDEDSVVIESVEIKQRDSKAGKPDLEECEIVGSLNDKQIEEVKDDCLNDWKKKLKDEE
jgi:hypothetical protein